MDISPAMTRIQNRVGDLLVSTVRLSEPWLYWGVGEQLWYETMVFRVSDDGDIDYRGDLYCARYSSLEEAQEGHDDVVRRLETEDLQV